MHIMSDIMLLERNALKCNFLLTNELQSLCNDKICDTSIHFTQAKAAYKA